VVAVVTDVSDYSGRSLEVAAIVPGVVTVVPDVPGCRRRSQEVVEVVSDVFGGSGRSLEVVAVVPDVSDYCGMSLEVVAVVPDVPGGSVGRRKWPQ